MDPLEHAFKDPSILSNLLKVFMHNEAGIKGGLELDTWSSYCDTNPVAYSWLTFYDDCEGQVRRVFTSTIC